MTETTGEGLQAENPDTQDRPSISDRLQASGDKLAAVKKGLDEEAAKREGKKEETRSPGNRMAAIREQAAKQGEKGRQLLDRIRQGGAKPPESTPKNPGSK
jgi:hypothetical protein